MVENRVLSMHKKRPFLINPYPADHNYCPFESVLLVLQNNVIGNEMSV